jgi:hypothetical protein
MQHKRQQWSSSARACVVRPELSNTKMSLKRGSVSNGR